MECVSSDIIFILADYHPTKTQDNGYQLSSSQINITIGKQRIAKNELKTREIVSHRNLPMVDLDYNECWECDEYV